VQVSQQPVIPPLGACTWLWTAPFGDRDADLASRVAEIGFDVLEVCVEDPSLVTAEALVAAGEQAGVAYSVCAAFGPERDLAHSDPGPQETALRYIGELVDLAAAVGSPHICGPMYSAVGKGRLEDPDDRAAERRRSVENLKRAAERAAVSGIRLAIEPLNRYETDMVNTVEQGLELCDAVAADNVGLLLDTYHLNIEEKSLGDAIRLAGDRVFHFHSCENDRGTPGTGHVPWSDAFSALADIGYRGQVVIESFTPAVKEIARAVSLWRPLDASGDELASGGLAFLRSELATAWRQPAPAPAHR
jgi:D-psicose/D-tagatose/L-ribulose 3-epimerase